MNYKSIIRYLLSILYIIYDIFSNEIIIDEL